MNVKMYGKSQGCKFCTTAKQICEANGFNLEFIDIVSAGIGVDELREIVGQTVSQVPQIFVNNEYVGGCDKFISFLKGE